MALETPYGVRTLTMARSVRSIENRVYPVFFRFKFNVCTLHANSCTTYTISAEVEPSRATYTTTEYKQVTWRFQCQSRWPFNRNTVLAVGRRRSGTCKGGLPRPPLGSAADIRRHLGVRDLTSVEDLFFSILDVDVINSIGWEVTTFTRTVFDCMLIVIGCFIFNHVGFEVSHRTRKAHLHLGMDPWIHSRYYIKVLGEGCSGIDVLVFYQIFQIFQGYCMYSSTP